MKWLAIQPTLTFGFSDVRHLSGCTKHAMATVLLRILSPAPLLYSLVVITQFAYGAYLGAELEFPGAATFIFTVGLLWAVGWWLRRDNRRRGVLSIYDIGFFLYLAWPIVMPYYLIKTRGAKGLVVMLGFVAAYVGAAMVGIVFSVVIVAMRS